MESLNTQEVKDYLDNAIRKWRKRRDEEKDPIAVYYVDAFQSVRVSLLGELLPDESEEADNGT